MKIKTHNVSVSIDLPEDVRFIEVHCRVLTAITKEFQDREGPGCVTGFNREKLESENAAYEKERTELITWASRLLIERDVYKAMLRERSVLIPADAEPSHPAKAPRKVPGVVRGDVEPR